MLTTLGRHGMIGSPRSATAATRHGASSTRRAMRSTPRPGGLAAGLTSPRRGPVPHLACVGRRVDAARAPAARRERSLQQDIVRCASRRRRAPSAERAEPAGAEPRKRGPSEGADPETRSPVPLGEDGWRRRTRARGSRARAPPRRSARAAAAGGRLQQVEVRRPRLVPAGEDAVDRADPRSGVITSPVQPSPGAHGPVGGRRPSRARGRRSCPTAITRPPQRVRALTRRAVDAGHAEPLGERRLVALRATRRRSAASPGRRRRRRPRAS